MKLTISAQQGSFFTKHGSLNEIPHADLFPAIERGSSQGRDLWRKEPALQKFLTRTIAPLVFALTGKKQLFLGCDQWVSERAAGSLKRC